MKKIILLPIVLATCGFAMLPVNKAIQTAEAEETTINTTLKQVIKDFNVHSNGTVAEDLTNSLVTYGMRVGNPETGEYHKLTRKHDWNGDYYYNDMGVEWDAARLYAPVGSSFMVYFKANTTVKFTANSGQPWGTSQHTSIKYYTALSTFECDEALTPVHTAVRGDGNWNPTDLAYETTILPGESFVWAWENTNGVELQTLENISFTLTEVAEDTSVKTASLTTLHVFDEVARLGGEDLSNDIASYGMRFGKLTPENPYSSEYTVDTNAKSFTADGMTQVWWKLFTKAGNGFAFTITAKQRLTVNVNFKGYNSAYFDKVTTVSYSVVRNNKVVATVYSNNDFTGSFATDSVVLNYPSAIELIPGDSLYLGFNSIGEPAGDAHNLMLGSYDNLTFDLQTVAISNKATALVKSWLSLRNKNSNDFCELTAKDSAKLAKLIETYYTLSTEDMAVVGRTLDVNQYTIADSIAYFEAKDASLKPLQLVKFEDNSLIAIICIAGSIAILATTLIVIKKRKAK